MSIKKPPRKKKAVKTEGPSLIESKHDDRTRITIKEAELPKSFNTKLKESVTLEITGEVVETGLGSYGEDMGKKYVTLAVEKRAIKS